MKIVIILLTALLGILLGIVLFFGFKIALKALWVFYKSLDRRIEQKKEQVIESKEERFNKKSNF